MIIIESKRKKAAIERKQNKACLGYAECEQARLYVKAATILKKYPDAILADVTSGSKDGLVKLSPFYPHGGIPVPFSEGCCAHGLLDGHHDHELHGARPDHTLNKESSKVNPRQS